MRNRNLLVLAIVAGLILIVVLLAFLPQAKREVTVGATVEPVVYVTPTPTVEASSAPSSTSSPSATAAPSGTSDPVATETPEQASAYLLVTVSGVLYEPIPLYGSADYTVRQGDEMQNVIHVTPTSVCMQSSTCDNQDCVLQGTVTLENMSQRVLGNMVVCLPNQVTLELFTPEGLAEALVEMGIVTTGK